MSTVKAKDPAADATPTTLEDALARIAQLEDGRHNIEDGLGLGGTLSIVVRGPDGRIKHRRKVKNLITQRGDQYYMERATGIGTPPGQITGAKLGTGTTTPGKTGAAAAAIASGTYIAGSQRAIDGGFPTSTQVSANRQIQWKITWPAAVATNGAITEVVLVIDTLADAASSETNTVARATFTAVPKGAQDSLEITWNHNGQGT